MRRNTEVKRVCAAGFTAGRSWIIRPVLVRVRPPRWETGSQSLARPTTENNNNNSNNNNHHRDSNTHRTTTGGCETSPGAGRSRGESSLDRTRFETASEAIYGRALPDDLVLVPRSQPLVQPPLALNCTATRPPRGLPARELPSGSRLPHDLCPQRQEACQADENALARSRAAPGFGREVSLASCLCVCSVRARELVRGNRV